MTVDGQNSDQQDKGSVSFGHEMLGAIRTAYLALFRDGALGRAGSQGLDELGQALKAFPDSVHAGERETVHSSPDDDRRNQHLPSPGDIAKGQNFMQAEHGNVYGNQQIVADNEKGFVERELERRENAGNSADQNERFRARILPVEQREQQEQERSR